MRLLVDEAFAQVSRVELLEDVFVVEVFEDRDGGGQPVVNLALRDSLLRLFQQGVAIPGKQLGSLGRSLGGTVVDDG